MSAGQEQHLSPEQLERLVHESLEWAGQTQVLTHLALCEGCRHRLVDLYPTHGPALLVRYLGTDHLPAIRTEGDGAVRQAIAIGLEGVSRARRELAEADRKWAELRDLPTRELIRRLTRNGPPVTLGMTVILLEESRGRWEENPRDAEALADLALDVLEQCRGYPDAQLEDLRARALAYRSNCRRLRGRLGPAQSDMDRARKHLARGSRDPLEWAQLLEHESFLLCDRGNFRRAAEALQQSSELHEATGDPQAGVRLRVLGALVLRDAGSPEQALELLENLTEQHTLDEMGLENHFELRYHKALLLMELERDGEARGLLGELRRTATLRGLPVVARVEWLEAVLLHRVGRMDEAEALYRSVHDVYRARGLVFESVVAALDLALLLIEAGRGGGIRFLAEDLADRPLAHELPPETLAALYAFQRAAARDEVTLEVIQETRHVLHRPRSRRPVLPSPR